MMSRRQLTSGIIYLVLAGIAAAAIFAYSEFTRKNKDLKKIKADIEVAAPMLSQQFESNFNSSDSAYNGKFIQVSGAIKQIDSLANPVIIFLETHNGNSSVQCSMDSVHFEDYKYIKPRDSIKIKGLYTGATSDEIFGIDIKLNRSVICN